MIFYQLFEPTTSTYTYVIGDSVSREAIIIDSVLEMVERDLKIISELGLKLKYIADTHVHADHITGSGSLRLKTGAQTAISQYAKIPCIDIELKNNDELFLGNLKITAIETQGHTNSCMSFICEGMIFTGDVLLIRGTGRTDFQQGDAEKMYHSINDKIFSLPDETKIYPGHDYKGFTYSTVLLEKKFNPRIGNDRNLADFKKIMAELKLAPPAKIDVAVPANLQCGLIPN